METNTTTKGDTDMETTTSPLETLRIYAKSDANGDLSHSAKAAGMLLDEVRRYRNVLGKIERAAESIRRDMDRLISNVEAHSGLPSHSPIAYASTELQQHLTERRSIEDSIINGCWVFDIEPTALFDDITATSK